MKEQVVKVPAEADEMMDQELLDIGVKFVEETTEQPAKREAKAGFGKWERVHGFSVRQIVRSAKSVVICAGAGLVLLWWLKAGLLSPDAAWPAFVVVALLGGVSLGRCLVKR